MIPVPVASIGLEQFVDAPRKTRVAFSEEVFDSRCMHTIDLAMIVTLLPMDEPGEIE